MQTSAKGVAFIAAHEGVVTRAYRDVAGVWTIGVGHTAAAGPPIPRAGMSISRDEAMRILAADLPRYERRVERALPGIAQSAFDGAVSFDFNTGAIDRASWVPAFRSGALVEARARLLQWTKAGGRVVAGLVRRRAAEASLILDGRYGVADAPTTEAPSSVAGSESEAWLRKLAALGFAGSDTVRAYQRSHPDLVADGILGPATRAGIDRDLAARAALRGLAGGGAIGAGGAVAAGAPGWAVVVLVVALAVAAGFAAWRWRGEFRRILSSDVIPAKAANP